MSRLWTHKEILILKKMYPNYMAKDIAKKLNRTVNHWNSIYFINFMYNNSRFSLTRKKKKALGLL